MDVNGNNLSGAAIDSKSKRRMRPIAMDSSCKTWWFGANDSTRGAMSLDMQVETVETV